MEVMEILLCVFGDSHFCSVQYVKRIEKSVKIKTVLPWQRSETLRSESKGRQTETPKQRGSDTWYNFYVLMTIFQKHQIFLWNGYKNENFEKFRGICFEYFATFLGHTELKSS